MVYQVLQVVHRVLQAVHRVLPMAMVHTAMAVNKLAERTAHLVAAALALAVAQELAVAVLDVRDAHLDVLDNAKVVVVPHVLDAQLLVKDNAKPHVSLLVPLTAIVLLHHNIDLFTKI